MLVFLGNCGAYAVCDDFICPQNRELSNKFLRTMSTATGTNALATKTAEAVIKSQIKKQAKGKFDVDLKSFSVSDLKAGRFKSLEITGHDIDADGISLSYLKLKTLCDYNYITYDKNLKQVVFKEDFGVAFAGTVTEDDLNKTMQAVGYNDLVDEINSMGSGFFHISSSKVKIRKNKFMYVIQIEVPFIGVKKDLVAVADINVRNGRIIFSHTQLLNNKFSADLSKLTYAMNYLNPLNFTFRFLENKDANMQITDAVIKDDKINVGGVIIVNKDVVTTIED